MSKPVIKNIKHVAGFGWSPELPSIKDWKFGMHPKFAKAELSPESQDRRALGLNAPVRDQGSLGSCVGHALTYGVGFLRRTDRDDLSTTYSALQSYYDARVADGDEWKTVDSGAYIRDGVDMLRGKGVAPESKWPYKIAKFATTPPKNVYAAAASWKLGAHWRCETVEDICRALDAGFAVVGGIVCYSSMFSGDVDRTGRVPMPSRNDTIEGGHALYFDRHVQSDRLLRFENSWTNEWGDGGYGYLPFEYADNRDLSDDFWAMEAESPETTPWKD